MSQVFAMDSRLVFGVANAVILRERISIEGRALAQHLRAPEQVA